MPSTFRIRDDKNAVDLEISALSNLMYLTDRKSGGKGFDFRRFVKARIAYYVPMGLRQIDKDYPVTVGMLFVLTNLIVD